MDDLKPGYELKIGRYVNLSKPLDISELTALPIEKLNALRNKSAAAETAIFDKLCADAGTWEEQAAKTMRIDLAIEYAKTPAIGHTANKWQPDKYDNGLEISNMVYKMYCNVREDTQYNRETKQREPVSWHLTWVVHTRSADGYNSKNIAGQTRKRFTDKADMERYLQGRIKACSYLFTEISPPVPKEYERYFCVNGQLLPGYTVQGQERQNARERPSAMDKLAAAKEAVAKNDAGRADKAKDKKRDTEL